MYAKENGYRTIEVRTPDSDIFFILLHYIDKFESVTLLFDTGTGSQRKLINMTEIACAYTREYREALLGLHAFCGCESTSAFKGRGHVAPIKTLKKRSRLINSLAQLGSAWIVSSDLTSELEEFTCAMYGNLRFTEVDDLKHLKMTEKCEDKASNALRNVDIGTLHPCKKCLVQHIKMAHYQVAIWKCPHIADPDISEYMVVFL